MNLQAVRGSRGLAAALIMVLALGGAARAATVADSFDNWSITGT